MSATPGGQPPFSGPLPGPPPIRPPPPVAAAAVPRPVVAPPSLLAPSPVTLLPPGAAGTAAPVVRLPKMTNLYVGNIARGVSDGFMRQLLEACGPVKEWKRLEDPDTKQLKPFGFCIYEEAEGVKRAQALLNDTAVAGQKLLLKCSSQTQQYLDSVDAAKRAAGPPDADEGIKAAEKDNAALEKIMALVATLPQALPPPPDAAAQADSFLAGLQREESARQKARRRERVEREEERSEGGSARERERREAEARTLELDAAYKAALRKWEAAESDRRRLLDREREHERDLAKERERALASDLEPEEAEVWRRKLYAGSRRAADRKRRREKELREDEEDREREADELAKKARLEEKERAAAAERAANGHASGSASPAAAPANPRLEDPNDSITQAMMNAAKESLQRPALSPAHVPAPDPEPEPAHAAAEHTAPPAAAPRREPPVVARPAPKPRAVLAAFAAVEEEEEPRRTLRPINYTEEERAAAARAAPADKAAAVKELIAAVPTDKDEVFSHAVDWAAFDAGGDEMREKVKKWVSKKTAELLGEEEASMVDFIIGQLQEHTAAPKLLEELQAVLDDEASPFVFKLYRMVIFETLKQAAGLQD